MDGEIIELRPGGPVDTFRAIVADLRRREMLAAQRCKVTLWAYYGDMGDDLERQFADVSHSDGGYAGAALALSQRAERLCPELPRMEAARLWALGIYCRRILGAWTPGEPLAGYRPGLGWLRQRAGVQPPLPTPPAENGATAEREAVGAGA